MLNTLRFLDFFQSLPTYYGNSLVAEHRNRCEAVGTIPSNSMIESAKTENFLPYFEG